MAPTKRVSAFIQLLCCTLLFFFVNFGVKCFFKVDTVLRSIRQNRHSRGHPHLCSLSPLNAQRLAQLGQQGLLFLADAHTAEP